MRTVEIFTYCDEYSLYSNHTGGTCVLHFVNHAGVRCPVDRRAPLTRVNGARVHHPCPPQFLPVPHVDVSMGHGLEGVSD